MGTDATQRHGYSEAVGSSKQRLMPVRPENSQVAQTKSLERLVFEEHHG